MKAPDDKRDALIMAMAKLLDEATAMMKLYLNVPEITQFEDKWHVLKKSFDHQSGPGQ